MSNCELRDLQLCEYEILKDIKKVCEEEGIKYYLTAGTLLGAVRHKGFIPWDDDVDLIMPVDDYLRFLAIAQEKLGDQYFVQTSETDEDYGYLFAKVRKNGTTMLSPWEKNNPGHHGIWVDIFPQIPIRGKADLYIKNQTARFSNFLCMNDVLFKHNYKYLVNRSNPYIMKVIKLIRKIPKKSRKKLHLAIQKALIRNDDKAPLVGLLWTIIIPVVPKEIFEQEPKTLLFETEEFPVPPDYDKYLTIRYGDYMTPPPENKRNGGHGNMIIDLEKEIWR